MGSLVYTRKLTSIYPILPDVEKGQKYNLYKDMVLTKKVEGTDEEIRLSRATKGRAYMGTLSG